jgi:hypothetical protein
MTNPWFSPTFGTFGQATKPPLNRGDALVAGVGFEPTTFGL